MGRMLLLMAKLWSLVAHVDAAAGVVAAVARVEAKGGAGAEAGAEAEVEADRRPRTIKSLWARTSCGTAHPPNSAE